MKLKIGICIECGPDGAPTPLIAKRCKNHYWKHRNEVNAKKSHNKAKTQAKQVLGTFFASQTLVMPKCCEECGNVLPVTPSWMRRACIAHILPKRPDYGFPSVAIHPMNKIFLCPDCHTNMDNLGDRFILKMKTLPVMIERVAILIPLLPPEELNRLPDYFLKAS